MRCRLYSNPKSAIIQPDPVCHCITYLEREIIPYNQLFKTQLIVQQSADLNQHYFNAASDFIVLFDLNVGPDLGPNCLSLG